MLRLKREKCYRLLCLLLLLLGSVSCGKKEVTDLGKAWLKAEAFFKRLPLASPDSSIAMIAAADSLKESNAFDALAIMIINNALLATSGEGYLKYMHYLEPKIAADKYRLRGMLYIFWGQRNAEMARPDSSFSLMREGMALLLKSRDSMSICQGYLHIAMMRQWGNGNGGLPIEASIEGLKYLPKLEDSKQMGRILSSTLVRNYSRMKLYAPARALIHKNLRTSIEEKDTAAELFATIQLSLNFGKMHEKDSMVWAAAEASRLFAAMTSTNEDKYSDNFSLNMAQMWKDAGSPEKAFEYLAIIEKRVGGKDSLTLSVVYNELLMFKAGTYMVQGNMNEAERYYQRLLAKTNTAEHTKGALFLNGVMDSLVVIQLKKSKQDKQLSYFYQSRQVADSLAAYNSQQVWSEMNIRYETEQKEAKIAALSYANLLWQLQAITALFILAVSICIVAWYSYRNRQRQALLLKENELLESKQLLQTLDLSNQQKQLGDLTENIFFKSKLIQELEQNMQQLKATAAFVSQEVVSKNETTLKNLRILTENDWQTYLAHIEKVNPTLIERMNVQFKLSQAEFRLFLLIRQGLEKEAISSTLGISAEGTRKSYYRLRKKLELDDDKELEQFIVGF